MITPVKSKSRTSRRLARIVLEIAETRYLLNATPCATGIGRQAFRLTKDDGTIYDVLQSPYGPECDCPDFIFRRDGLDPAGCKHIQALVAAGMMVGNDVRWEAGPTI